MAGGRRLDRRAPVPIREGRGCQGEDVRPAVARDPVDGPERRGTRVLGGGDRGDPRDLAWSRRSQRPEADGAGGLRGRTRGPGPREPDGHEHGERRRRTPGPPEAPRRTPVDDQTRCPPVVPPPDGPPRLRLRHRQHGDQRRDRAARREREGTGGPIPRDRECDTRNRPDHPGRIGRAPPQRPRRGRTSNGPEPHASQSTRRGSSNARPPGGRRAEDELRREAHRGRRRRQHRGPFGPPRGDHRGDSRRGRKSVRRHVGPDRSGEPFMRPVQAHKIRATREERAAEPRSLLVVHATELLSLRGPPGPRRHEAAGELGIVEDGALYAEGERIVDVGATAEVLGRHPRASVTIDATGQTVLPGFVDAHTHSVFAGTREHEVDWKAKGMGYREIAARGGGILHTVRATRDAREEDLVRTAAERPRAMLAFGTTTIEVKSGYGLRPADELADSGGAALAADLGAASADHLLHSSPEGIDALARTAVVGVLLPAASLVSHLPFADGRRLIAAGVAVALGTDFNPNCWSESTQLTIALACHHNGLLPSEAGAPATINSAHAIGLGDQVGSLEPGKLADLVILGVPSYRHLGYRIGGNAARVVIKRGAVQVGGPLR